ncbi:CoF synthetase [Ichthyenterobacterium sp. W332]|uniref:CoF synthetase n=1 Tax=Microcosmobacter mediterraneus TaxID=3075607 RepID=A0ABU2YKP7_9FLAO|nr:CoF synthetase [Ichthyenterobacterium sp. W332]MDT0558741.1 CoF synthetase [Ichthyenterobacterium sp. W332]
MFLNSLRHFSFWLLDTLKGGHVKKHYTEVTSILKAPNSKNAEAITSKHIGSLLKHATETTAFYKPYTGKTKIEDFPVIRKTVIQQNFEQFESSIHRGKNNYKVSTSGSTGVPFFLFQNAQKRHRNHADVMYYYNSCNFKIGNRLYELEVWRDHNKKGKLISWLQNVCQFDISRLTDNRIETFLNLLKTDNQKGKTLLGFASAFELIAQYLERNNLNDHNLGINCIIANSEYLNAYTKNTLNKHLDIPVLSRYSSEEIGMIAQQTLSSTESFKVNHASYHLEILAMDSDNHVAPGEFGRIVVTDLFNYAMPIIRYDTGDIARYKLDDDGVMEFDQIEGRKMDLIYDTKGNIISSFVVYTKFYKYYKLLQQYQFIQQGQKSYEIKLNIHDDDFPFEKDLIADIKSDFGDDAEITLTYVDEIPPLSSGKRRKVVNNYKLLN